MRVHYPNPASDVALAQLRNAVGPEIVVSTGEASDRWEVLVEGRPTQVQVASPDLRAVIIPFAGPSAATLELLRSRPALIVCNLHHNAADTAELALALLLAAAKEIVPLDRKMRALDWSPRYLPTSTISLEEKRALVLGYGHIGSRIARSLKSLSMEIRALRRSATEGYSDEFAEIHPRSDLNRLLPSSDVLIIALPETAETNALIGSRELGLLPQGAILINIARASIVDEQALFEALQSGHLHSAGLDVWYSYPQGRPSYFPFPDGATNTRPSRFPFETLENVVMSPHRGGISTDTEGRRVRDIAAILIALKNGESPPNQMNLEAGY